MDKFQKHIDNLITKILNEEIENKVKQITENKGEWQEIEVGEELKGGQKKIDMNKNNKIDAEDFKLLRKKKAKKHEMDEWFFYDEKDKSVPGDYEGDEEQEEEAEELSQNEPTYVGKGLEDNKMKAKLKNKIFGSFSDDMGWFDEIDREHTGGFDFDYDEEEYDEFEPMFKKFGDKTAWFAPGDEGKKFFDKYKEKYGPMKIRIMKDLGEEAETEEGNAFSGALAKAKESGRDSFEVDGKKYHVRESKDKKCPKCGMINCKCNHKKETKESEKKWIQKTDMKKGALHKKLNVPEDEKIPQSKLKLLKKELMKKAEGDKKLSNADLKTLKQVNLALTLKGIKENENKITFTEDELIDLIENIVIEQKEKKEKSNISKKEPEGLKKTMKALNASKKENEDYAKSVVKKMKDYLKSGSNGEFSENPEAFPESNYDLSGMKEKTKKYHPSEAVDEYIDAFAYPGMTNLVYDEIKPEDEKIEMYLKGNSKTGNAVKDKDGKALGNVVPSEVGEKFMKNYKDNLYGAEQQNASYKRQPQPVDVAGETKSNGSLKKIKSSTEKSAKIFNQLESTEDKKSKMISEEMQKMKNLISYDRKTQ